MVTGYVAAINNITVIGVNQTIVPVSPQSTVTGTAFPGVLWPCDTLNDKSGIIHRTFCEILCLIHSIY